MRSSRVTHVEKYLILPDCRAESDFRDDDDDEDDGGDGDGDDDDESESESESDDRN